MRGPHLGVARLWTHARRTSKPPRPAGLDRARVGTRREDRDGTIPVMRTPTEPLESPSPMIDPRVASGLRDLPPSVMIPRERMLAAFRRTFGEYGFVPIETPHIERMEVLTGKGAGSDEVLRQI